MKLKQYLVFCIALFSVMIAPAFAQCRHCTGNPEKEGEERLLWKQSEVASKSTRFQTISEKHPAVAEALVATDTAEARKQKGKMARFTGTVTDVHFDRLNLVVEIYFDEKSGRDTLKAVVNHTHFDSFPDLNVLRGKKLLVTGRFTEYRKEMEIELYDPIQVQFVE